MNPEPPPPPPPPPKYPSPHPPPPPPPPKPEISDELPALGPLPVPVLPGAEGPYPCHTSNVIKINAFPKQLFFSFSQFPARTPPLLLRRIRRTPAWWPAPPRRQSFSFPLLLPLLLRRSRTRLLRFRSQPRLRPRRSRRSSRPPTIGDVRFVFPFLPEVILSLLTSSEDMVEAENPGPLGEEAEGAEEVFLEEDLCLPPPLPPPDLRAVPPPPPSSS